MTTPATRKPTNSRSIAPALHRQALSQSKAPDVDLRIRGFLTPLGANVGSSGRYPFAGAQWLRRGVLVGKGNLLRDIAHAAMALPIRRIRPLPLRAVSFGCGSIASAGALLVGKALKSGNLGDAGVSVSRLPQCGARFQVGNPRVGAHLRKGFRSPMPCSAARFPAP